MEDHEQSAYIISFLCELGSGLREKVYLCVLSDETHHLRESYCLAIVESNLQVCIPVS